MQCVVFWSVLLIKACPTLCYGTSLICMDFLEQRSPSAAFFPLDLGRRLFARAPSVLGLSAGRKQAPAPEPAALKGHAEANAFSNLLLVNIVGGGTFCFWSPLS